MNFRELLEDDLNAVFFNEDEFAEPHTIDGVVINCMIDNDHLMKRSKKEYDGISVGELLIFVKKSDINKKFKQGMPIVFDGRPMSIFDIREDMGIYEIILSQNLG
jgi:hypothetical protein